MSFCLVMVVNRVPNYPTFFIQRFKNTKSKYVFVPKMGCPGLQGIKIFSIYMFYLAYMSFCLVLVVYRLPDLFLHFLYNDSRMQNQILGFVPKIWLSRALGY